MDAAHLVGILAGTPPANQAAVLRAALADRWQAQLEIRLDFWAQDVLAQVRASSDIASAVQAVAPLLDADVWISPEWPDAGD
ncbi:MAG TPA: hypothetical protein PKH77_20225 [Anaerolineae bacterium]|nr:hypothetical protein [Anaerolineae bacterium]